MEIVVYGAGEIGKHALSRIKEYYADEVGIIGVLDKKAKSLTERNLNISECDCDSIIVIALGGRKTVVSIAYYLNNLGFRNLYLYLRKDNPRYDYSKSFLEIECIGIQICGNDIIPHIEIHAEDGCNLNCRGCAHFSPLYKVGAVDDSKRLLDIDLVKKISDNVLSLFILGGEPFENKRISDYFQHAREVFPNSDIQVVTNGLKLVSCEDGILEVIKNNRIIVAVSVYKPTAKILSEIMERLRNFHIEYVIRTGDKKEVFIKPLSTDANSKYEKMCLSDGCVSVCEGKVARCPTLMYIGAVNNQFNARFPKEGIYNLSEFENAESFNATMNKKVPLCEYCVNVEIEWARCNPIPTIDDFVSR